MDGSNMTNTSAASTEVTQDETRPGNRTPAEHAWLNADADDRAANFAAYRAACANLPDADCARIYALCDAAQITCITWLQAGRSFEDSFATAQAQHAALTKDTDP